MSNLTSNEKPEMPKIKYNRRISPLWLLPILALLVVTWMVFKGFQDAGERVQIYFTDAQGLVAGRTAIRYQGLEIGMVKDINLAKDLQSIYVDADIYPEAKKLLTQGARFWMVKPTATLSGISGLDTLVTGNYIAILPGDSTAPAERKFTALERAPSDLMESQGLNITLKAKDLGGISTGSKIIYKKIPIGEVYHYQLSSNSKYVLVQASIREEYRHIITEDSRFWNISGFNANLGFSGIDIHLDSIGTLVAGAIAVDSPDGGAPIANNTLFKLYPDIKTAGRGIAIKLELPENSHVRQIGSPIMYRGIEIGQITDLKLSKDEKQVIASAAIQPAFTDMLNTGSTFVLEEPKISLSGVENLTNIVSGNFLSLIPGQGQRLRSFSVIRKTDFSLQKDQAMSIKLTAEQSWGIEKGSEILYRGLNVGSVTGVKLTEQDKVQVDAIVYNQYTNLIKSKNRFYLTSSFRAKIEESGLTVSMPPAKQLLSGSISFTSEGDEKPRNNYTLYSNEQLAELASYDAKGSKKLSLYSPSLPKISKGSPILYRNLQVGKIEGYTLLNNGFKISASIDNQFKHLITKSSVFWVQSAIEINAGLAGVSIKAAPLKSLLEGGISFDDVPDVENKANGYWMLHSSYKQAKKYGQLISLKLAGDNKLSIGADINFNGIKVGEVTYLMPNFEQQSVTVEARILPEYTSIIPVKGSYFWLPTTEFGLNGIKNVDNLLSQSINVIPGKGSKQTTFELNSQVKEPFGVEFTLQSATKGSVTVGTPVLYREIEVGEVTDVSLGEFADRVLTTISIKPKFSYLVRQNSVFWNTSGVDVSIGLTGAEVKAGTLESIVRGGITFATPENVQLQPIAREESTFLLHSKAKPEWRTWRTAIPKPQ